MKKNGKKINYTIFTYNYFLKLFSKNIKRKKKQSQFANELLIKETRRI